MVNPTGYTALDFIGFTDKGAYAANVNYVKNDLVHYGGNIWRVLVDDTIGITPAEGTSYTLFIGEPTNLVERIIAPLEENPATIAYGVGRQIIYNNYLYEVVKNIAVGDILVAYEDNPTNANIKRASPVETQVLALNASKVNKNDVVNNVTTTTTGKVLDARQGKALQDGINTKINKSDIANNVTTTAEGKVLDARQGKTLQDGINTKVNKSDIANNVTTTAEGKVLDARQGKALQDGKADNSVIAPVESGTTASQAYAIGAHFIKDGAFCTAKTAIAQGEAFTLNTNYTVGTIGSVIKNTNAITSELATGNAVNVRFVKSGHTVQVMSISNANIAMEQGQTYVINYNLVYPPVWNFTFEAYCRNGISCYFQLRNDAAPQFVIVPRQNIAQGASISFSFTYITSA